MSGKGLLQMVTKLRWDSAWSVGVPEMDDQHRILSDLVNTLHDLAEQHADTEQVSVMLHRLIEYGAAHFNSEERLIAGSGYPEFEEHRLEHNRFIKTIADFVEDLTDGRKDVLPRTLDFLHEWFDDHVLRMDRDYVPYVTPQQE